MCATLSVTLLFQLKFIILQTQIPKQPVPAVTRPETWRRTERKSLFPYRNKPKDRTTLTAFIQLLCFIEKLTLLGQIRMLLIIRTGCHSHVQQWSGSVAFGYLCLVRPEIQSSSLTSVCSFHLFLRELQSSAGTWADVSAHGDGFWLNKASRCCGFCNNPIPPQPGLIWPSTFKRFCIVQLPNSTSTPVFCVFSYSFTKLTFRPREKLLIWNLMSARSQNGLKN